MAYPALAEKGVTPVFDEMMGQKLLKNNMFAFYLTTKQAENMGMKSDLTFGYYDKEKFKGDIHWNPIQFKYMFGVKLDDVKINGKSTGVCQGKECLITFDSGTSLMSMPTTAVEQLRKQGIPSSSNIVDCKSEKQFGDMELVIGGKSYLLTNEEWMMPAQSLGLSQATAKAQAKFGLGPQVMTQIDGFNMPDKSTTAQMMSDRKPHSHIQSKTSGSMKCASTIMPMDIRKSMFLVGDVFMRKYYTIFDRENDRVGLAEANTNDKVKALSQGRVNLDAHL